MAGSHWYRAIFKCIHVVCLLSTASFRPWVRIAQGRRVAYYRSSRPASPLEPPRAGSSPRLGAGVRRGRRSWRASRRLRVRPGSRRQGSPRHSTLADARVQCRGFALRNRESDFQDSVPDMLRMSRGHRAAPPPWLALFRQAGRLALGQPVSTRSGTSTAQPPRQRRGERRGFATVMRVVPSLVSRSASLRSAERQPSRRPAPPLSKLSFALPNCPSTVTRLVGKAQRGPGSRWYWDGCGCKASEPTSTGRRWGC